MTRPKGSKNKKPTQLNFASVDGSQPSVFEKVTYGVSDNLIIPEQILQDEVMNNMEITHSLKTINAGNFAEIELDLKKRFFDNGWRLFSTHFGGMQPEGMIIIYIFIREQ